jgi:uncharacterized protein YjbJ (UPF0337 family)
MSKSKKDEIKGTFPRSEGEAKETASQVTNNPDS